MADFANDQHMKRMEAEDVFFELWKNMIAHKDKAQEVFLNTEFESKVNPWKEEWELGLNGFRVFACWS